jgi:ABC-type nitrate/sulfonate/bicarbonate transport system permease component
MKTPLYTDKGSLFVHRSPVTLTFRRDDGWLRATGGVALVLAWELAAHMLASPVFPPLSQVAVALWRFLLSGAAWQHTIASLQHIGLGFCLAALVGGALGVAMTQSRAIYAMVMPLVDAVRPVAALTIFPLLILLLGLGLWSKVFVIFWTAWPPILLSTVQSIRQVDRSLLEAAQLDGAGRGALLWRITLPLASPGIITGLRIGMSTGWISLVAAEMLGASEGLGYTVLTSSQTFQFPTMYATIILIALVGLAMNTALAWIQHSIEERVCAQ